MNVIYGVTYDATDLTSDVGGQPRFTFQLVRGLDDSPEVRGVDTIIPGTAGRTARNRVRDRRTAELLGWVYGAGTTDALMKADFRDAMEVLRTLFSPTRSAAALVIALEDGGTATITARPLNMVVAEYMEGVAARVSVELEAIGADWVIT